MANKYKPRKNAFIMGVCGRVGWQRKNAVVSPNSKFCEVNVSTCITQNSPYTSFSKEEASRSHFDFQLLGKLST